MAESQLACMEDGHIGVQVPESRPEFYYSEEQRAAVEELLKNGDGAFKTRLKDDNMKDFLSAREVKTLNNNFKHYDETGDGDREGVASAGSSDSGVHSTYWPQMSDTEVPPLDIGWPSSGLFRGVTRVEVHTHPPKNNGPHIKEVVRRLIQGAAKVIAIVMDLLTDLQILQDLMDAAWRRSVPVYILLDNSGVPHFLDMCSRLQIGAQHLRSIRARTLRGVGFNLSFGKLPGAVCSKYMLVDGDKVVFGSYSFSWSTSRMDRNTIMVMTGQVVESFDQDFRELYAVSEKLDLFREFHVSPPAKVTPKVTPSVRSKTGSKRPPLPATTSRFQVSLGDAHNVNIEVPAHKYYNPKYFLLFPDAPHPARSLQAPTKPSDLLRLMEPPDQVTSSEKLDRLSPLPSEAPVEFFKKPNGFPQEKKRLTLRQRITKKLSSSKLSINSGRSSPGPGEPAGPLGSQDHLEVRVKSPSNKLKLLKAPSTLGARTDSLQTVEAPQDNISCKSQRQTKQVCKVS